MLKTAKSLSLVLASLAILIHPMAVLAGQDVSIRQLQDGRYCSNGLVGNFVIRSEDDWKRMWSTVYGLTWPLPPAPAVDYEREMVIAVYRRGMTLRDRVLVDRIKVRGRDYQVSMVWSTPDPKCGAARRITFPCSLVVVPKTNGVVRINQRTEFSRCDRPLGEFAVPHVGPSDVPNIPGPNLRVK
jgi:hypothetical protein